MCDLKRMIGNGTTRKYAANLTTGTLDARRALPLEQEKQCLCYR